MAQPHTRQAIVQAIMKRRGTEVYQKEKKSMKGYIPSYLEGDEKCVVCGDRATGYHYKCITCEGCKGFFRRTVQKNLQATYQCKHDNTCEINKTTRNQCQMCRYEKCVRVGMATELVLDDEKRQAKRRLIEQNRELRKHKELSHMMAQCGWRIERPSDQERELIDSIARAQCEAFQNTDMELKETLDSMTASEKFSTALTSSITSVVNFAKKIPLFITKVNAEDLIIILKGGCIDVITLRCVVSYERGPQCVTLFPHVKVTKENLRYTRLEPFAQSLFTLAEQFSTLELSHVDLAIMQAITLLSTDRPNISIDKKQVESAQGIVVKAFEHYTSEKWPNEPQLCAHLLIKLSEVRAVSSCLANSLMRMRLDDPEDLHKLFVNGISETHYNGLRNPVGQNIDIPVANPIILNDSSAPSNGDMQVNEENTNKASNYLSRRNSLFSTMMEDTRKALQESGENSPPDGDKDHVNRTTVKRPLSLPTKLNKEDEDNLNEDMVPSTSNVKHKILRRIRSHSPVLSNEDLVPRSHMMSQSNSLPIYVPQNIMSPIIYPPSQYTNNSYQQCLIFPNVSKTSNVFPVPLIHRFPIHHEFVPTRYHYQNTLSKPPSHGEKIGITDSDLK